MKPDNILGDEVRKQMARHEVKAHCLGRSYGKTLQNLEGFSPSFRSALAKGPQSRPIPLIG